MAICKQEAGLLELDLPPEFQELEGLLQADLNAIVTMLGMRAQERLMLTPKQRRQLEARLWNRLSGTLAQALEPYTAENR